MPPNCEYKLTSHFSVGTLGKYNVFIFIFRNQKHDFCYVFNFLTFSNIITKKSATLSVTDSLYALYLLSLLEHEV